MTLKIANLSTQLASFVTLSFVCFTVSAELKPAVESTDETKQCVAPVNTPIIPDGNVASKDELLAAQDAVKGFQELNLDFLECIDAKKAALDPESPENAEKVAELSAAGDAAIALEEAVAAEFNTARKIFMDR